MDFGKNIFRLAQSQAQCCLEQALAARFLQINPDLLGLRTSATIFSTSTQIVPSR